MKKLLAGCLVLLLSGAMVFASGAAETAEAEPGLNIVVVAGMSGVDDGGFNMNIYNGAVAFGESHPEATVTALREPTGDVSKSVTLANDVVADFDVEVCCGYQFAGITTVAKENSDTDFILVDTFPFDNEVLPNVYAMMFAEQESGFFAGLAAALESKTGKVAVVNGIAFPSNVNYQYGFECGVIYANEMYGSDVACVELPSQAGTDVTGTDVGGNYIGDFNDIATGKIVTNQLIDKGVDIVFVAAGASGIGCFTAAKESDGNCRVIGCDVDQWNDGENGNENVILTSVLKNMAVNVERVLDEIDDGVFEGANVLLTAQTDSTGYVKEAGRHQLQAGSIERLDAAYALIKDGSIIPASNFGGFTPEGFTVN